ncbi:MAG TPA: LysM peptidoglycan-binding domain-containing protein [Thermoanaerobaculia bacterium]|nr:LysM peptidoglycan-binding domain-containing protein [Thermoanaerobaculia bacterium]
MSRKTVAFAVSSLLLLCAYAAKADDQPPRDLKLVGDHWTAWDPPAPPPDAQVHTVVPGDTLWSLAAKFLGNPYLWPQLWEQNQYIRDAHWIYPGDPLILSTRVAAVEDLETVDLGGEGAPGEGEDGARAAGESGEESGAATEEELKLLRSAEEAAGAPNLLGSESDIYCAGYVGPLEETFPFSITGSEYDGLNPTMDTAAGAIRGNFGGEPSAKYGLDTGDIVYLNAGRNNGLAPGQVLTAVHPDDEVIHPVTGQVYGRLYRYSGRVRVLTAQADSSIAEIVFSCEPIAVGIALRPFEPQPVPLARRTTMRPPNLPSSAEKLIGGPVILLADDRVVSLGQDNVVYIDRGADDDVAPGDLYTIYRINKPGLPPVVLGELAVLSVHSRSSVARILQSRYTIHVGDRVEAK